MRAAIRRYPGFWAALRVRPRVRACLPPRRRGLGYPAGRGGWEPISPARWLEPDAQLRATCGRLDQMFSYCIAELATFTANQAMARLRTGTRFCSTRNRHQYSSAPSKSSPSAQAVGSKSPRRSPHYQAGSSLYVSGEGQLRFRASSTSCVASVVAIDQPTMRGDGTY